MRLYPGTKGRFFYSLSLALLSVPTLVGCKGNSPTATPPAPSASTAGAPDPYVEIFYQSYLKKPEAKVGNGRGGYWAAVATSMSPTMDPNKVSTRTALHYLGDPDFMRTENGRTEFAYNYVQPTPTPHDEVLFVDFDDAGNVWRIGFTNRYAVDFSGWRRYGPDTRAVQRN